MNKQIRGMGIACAGLALAVMAVLVLHNNWVRGPQEPLQVASASEAPAAARDSQKGMDYKTLLDDIDVRVAALQKRAASRPEDWLVREHLAGLQLERAGMSNQFGDFKQAEKTINAALAIAPAGSGPLMLAAKFNYSLHRLDRAEGYLDQLGGRSLHKANDGVSDTLLRADLAFHRGQYDTALKGLHAVSAVMPKAALTELAIYHSKTGGQAEAEALLNEAYGMIDSHDPHGRAWVKLQLGVLALEAGDYPEAVKRLEAADKELPGWWLVREHLAETYGRMGELDKAVEIYQEVITQTGLPQYMDALAGIYQQQGRQAEADKLVAEAAKGWEVALKQYPEAAGGHGLEHYLLYGPAPRALELALANYKTRPGGEAQVYLAKAYLMNQQPAKALEILRQTESTPYQSAELHNAASEAYAKLGQDTQAAAEHEQCLLLNPNFYGYKTQAVPPQWLATAKN